MTRRAADPRSSKPRAEGSLSPRDPQINSNENSKSRRLGWKRIDWCVRTGFVLAMGLGFAFITIQLLFPELHDRLWTSTHNRLEGFDELDARQLETPPAEPSDDSAHYFLSDFMHGNWIIGQSSWKFNSRDVVEVSEDLFSAPPRERRKPDGEFDDQTIIDILTAFNAKPTTRETPDGTFTYWRLSAINGIQASVFTELVDGQLVVQLFRAALPTETGYQFVEVLPRDPLGSKAELLMPICPELEQIATRMDETGRSSSAMLSLQGDLELVLQHWRSCGWVVRKLDRPGSRSDQFECRQGNQLIHATILELAAPKRAILLVRIPDSSGE